MVTSGFPVRFAFLIEMEVEEYVCSLRFDIGMESGKTGSGERSNEAHLFTFPSLKGISGAAHQIQRVLRWISDDDSHKSVNSEHITVNKEESLTQLPAIC